jgi:hypothetical protein
LVRYLHIDPPPTSLFVHSTRLIRSATQYYPNTPLLGVKPNAALAKFIQKAIVDFTRYSDPNPEDAELWTAYTESNRQVMNYGDPDKPFNYGTTMGADLLDPVKCDYWQDAPYYITPSKQSDNGEDKKGKGKETPGFMVQRGREFVMQTDL